MPGRIISQGSLRRREVRHACEADEMDRPDESQTARNDGRPPRADQIARQKIARPRLRFARAAGASGNFLKPSHFTAQAKRRNALYFQGENWRPRELRTNHRRTGTECAGRDLARAHERHGARGERETDCYGEVKWCRMQNDNLRADSPSSRPSPPVGEKVPEGRMRGAARGFSYARNLRRNITKKFYGRKICWID